METILPYSRVRFACARLCTITAIAAVSAGIATPAMAVAGSTPPVSIVSAGNAVAVAADLTIDKIALKNNDTVAATKVNVQFDLQTPKGSPWPFSFDTYLSDQHCSAGQTIPSYSMTCQYDVQIVPGATTELTAKLRLSPSTDSSTAPSPSVKITVGTGAASDSKTIGPITRVKREADLAVSLANTHLKGRVGDTVDVPWIVTNKGPDAVPGVGLILIAPPGTEWTGPAAARCDPPAIPKTKYRCISSDPLQPGTPHILTETWQLKIVSATVGNGQIFVTSDLNAGSPDPYLDITDPNRANNTVPINIEVATTPGGGTSASPAPTSTPGASSKPVPGTLPMTGTNVFLIVAGGLTALIIGAVLTLIARRRRVRFTSND